eukprot:g5328.t1
MENLMDLELWFMNLPELEELGSLNTAFLSLRNLESNNGCCQDPQGQALEAQDVGMPLTLSGKATEERPTHVFDHGAAYTGSWSGQRREGYGVQV